MRSEGKPKPTIGLPGSSVAEVDLGPHLEPGTDDLHKPVDLHARIANLADEHYQRRGRQDGRALQDWLQAEREISGT